MDEVLTRVLEAVLVAILASLWRKVWPFVQRLFTTVVELVTRKKTTLVIVKPRPEVVVLRLFITFWIYVTLVGLLPGEQLVQYRPWLFWLGLVAAFLALNAPKLHRPVDSPAHQAGPR